MQHDKITISVIQYDNAIVQTSRKIIKYMYMEPLYGNTFASPNRYSPQSLDLNPLDFFYLD